jgi:flagellar motor switch/type III secretory pathway protein FliN
MNAMSTSAVVFDHLLHIPADVAALGNRLYASRSARMAAAGKLVWQETNQLTQLPTGPDALRLELTNRAGRSATLSLANPVLLSEHLQGPNQHLDDQALGYLAQCCCAELLDQLERSLGMGFDVHAASYGAQALAAAAAPNAPAPWRFAFDWVLQDGMCIAGALESDAAFWAQTMVQAPWATGQHGALATRFAFKLLVGSTCLPISELATLEAGGWLGMENHAVALHTRSRVRLQGVHVELNRTASIDGKGRLTMSEDLNTLVGDGAGLPAAAQAAELMVRLHFEVGSVRLALGEVLSARPGYVFDLGKPIEEHTVRVLLDGAELGSGRLVRIGDQLGVRLDSARPVI